MCLAIPGKIVELAAANGSLATVEVAGVRRKIDLGLLQDDLPGLGDWVLIHVGFAMSKLDEKEAQETLRLLHQLGTAYTDELKMLEQSQIE